MPRLAPISLRSLRVACAGTLLLAAGCGAPVQPERPNVLWICVDVLRADRLGAYGHDAPTSPRLDRLAEEGVLFERTWAQSSWTAPSVPSFFTSAYPVQHGVLEGSTQDREGRIVSDVLTERWTTAAELFRAGGYATGAFVTNAQLRGFLGYAQGFDVYREELGRAREINETFLDWADSAGRPFFGYLHYLDVHWPYRPEPEHLAPFEPPETDLDFTGPEAPGLLDRINAGEVELRDADRRALLARYDATVRQVDAAVEGLLARLAERDELENTLVVVSSDHGEELFEHGIIGHGRSLRETLVHVPWILAGPGVPAGRRLALPTETLDILPTLLELAELPAPEGLRGQSRVPLLAASPEPPQAGEPPPSPLRPVFAQLLRQRSYHRAVRLGDWKLVEDYRFRSHGRRAEPRGRLEVEAGDRIKLYGAFQDDGRFLAAGFEREPDGPPLVIRGRIEALDLAEGWLEIGRVRVLLPDGVSWRHRDRWLPLDPEELAVGSLVEVDGRPDAQGRVSADKVELRTDEREALRVKLEGRVDAVRPAAPPTLELLGLEVAFEGDVPLPGIVMPGEREVERPLDEASLADPEVAVREVSLYDLASDPGEHRDVAGAHPDRVAELAVLLAEGRSRRAEGSGPDAAAPRRALDAETRERLRALGYVE